MRTCIRLLSAVLLLAGAAVASAQAQTTTPPANAPAQNIPDHKLDAAAAALDQIAKLKEDYQQRIEAADAADKQQIVDEANKALVKAITDQGLSVEEYTAILVVAQHDPTAREKILQRLHSSGKK